MIFPEYIPFKQLPELTDKDLQNITFDEHGDLYFKNALLQYSLNANHERCINYQGNLTHAGLILFKLTGYSIIDRHIKSYKKIIIIYNIPCQDSITTNTEDDIEDHIVDTGKEDQTGSNA